MDVFTCRSVCAGCLSARVMWCACCGAILGPLHRSSGSTSSAMLCAQPTLQILCNHQLELGVAAGPTATGSCLSSAACSPYLPAHVCPAVPASPDTLDWALHAKPDCKVGVPDNGVPALYVTHASLRGTLSISRPARQLSDSDTVQCLHSVATASEGSATITCGSSTPAVQMEMRHATGAAPSRGQCPCMHDCACCLVGSKACCRQGPPGLQEVLL